MNENDPSDMADFWSVSGLPVLHAAYKGDESEWIFQVSVYGLEPPPQNTEGTARVIDFSELVRLRQVGEEAAI